MITYRVPVNYVLDSLADVKTGVNVVILDACRNNPFKSLFKSQAHVGLAAQPASSGTLIAYATGEGKVALNGAGKNSPYVEALQQHLLTPNISITDMFTLVRQTVKQLTDHAQEPAYYAELNSIFYLQAESIIKPEDVIEAPETILPKKQTTTEVQSQSITQSEPLIEASEIIVPKQPQKQGTKISRYIAYKDGTALDTVIGLMWMRCSVGQVWRDGRCQGEAEAFTWKQARPQSADFAGFDDWRIPTIEELRSLVYCSNKEGYFNPDVSSNGFLCGWGIDVKRPTIQQQVFPNTPATPFWSGSPVAGNPDRAWVVNFGNGNDGSRQRGKDLAVRLVRGRQ